jgi:hypothetical protein
VTENWITVLEHHISFAFIAFICGTILKNHKLYIKAKERLNDLWWDRCADRQEPYTPVENGAAAVVPPRPSPSHGD